MNRLIRAILLIGAFASVAISQGSVLLVGGGSENYGDWSDVPYRWLVTHAPNRKVIVLNYADTSTFFSGYFPSLSPCTVSNLAITTTAQANDSVTYRFIIQNDGIFLRGGDQAQYAGKWKGTLTQKAIREVFQRGGVVGGTSAGEMVLSDVAYLAGSSDAGALLRNPTSAITLEDDFLGFVPSVLAESHTNERGRIGRCPVFLARYDALKGRRIAGIAVDANTALAVDPAGVGEVMGGSSVTLLRWKTETQYSIEAGKSFSMSNLAYDQMLPGFKVDLVSGVIQRTASAVTFVPKLVAFPPGTVILDGSGKSSDWSSASGSLHTLQTALVSPSDTVGIFSSPASIVNANTVLTALSSMGVASRVLWIDESRKNDAGTASTVASCGAFVFVANVVDSLARVLDSSTAAGAAFRAGVAAGRPLLFLGDDGMLAGEQAISGLYSSAYGAYYGTLTQKPGLNLLHGTQVVPRFYQNADNTSGYTYSENRISAMVWSMAKSQIPYGIVIDAGSHVIIANGAVNVRGVSSASTSVLILDARSVAWSDLPVFHRPGKPNAVETAALLGATLHFVRPGDAAVLTGMSRGHSSIPGLFHMDQNYPNPFNPSTTIRFSIPHSGSASLSIYDLLGRQVAHLFDHDVQPGVYEVRWNAAGSASGVYVARLDRRTDGVMQSESRKIVLCK